MRFSFRLTLIVTSSTALLGAAMAQDFPRQSYDGAPNGLAAPFVGLWGMKYPEPEGTIVSAVIVPCSDPIRIEAAGETQIDYISPGREPVRFEVFEFEGRTTWFPDVASTSISVWLTPDSFHLHPTDMGRADWNDPRLFYRCGSVADPDA